MQPHTGALITLLAQLRYDVGDSYYKVDSEWNHKQYSITLHDVFRHQLVLRVGNVYPCYSKVHLEVGGEFSLQSTLVEGSQIDFINMPKECHFKIEHSHTNIVEEKYRYEFDRNIVWIRRGEYNKENGWRASFEGRYEASYRRSEIKDSINANGNRIEEIYRYILP